jgi:hypothetical protein
LSLINPWLDKFYRITTKSTTVTFHLNFLNKHSPSEHTHNLLARDRTSSRRARHGGSRFANRKSWGRTGGGSSDEWASETLSLSEKRIFGRRDASARSGGESDGRSMHALALPTKWPAGDLAIGARAPALRLRSCAQACRRERARPSVGARL